MFDVVDERVTLVESLEKKRQPFPKMDAIYFLSSSTSSVECVISDFKSGANYAGAHLFFLSEVGWTDQGLDWPLGFASTQLEHQA